MTAAGLVVDLFAGGGGASAGLEAALGRPVDRERFASHVTPEPGDGCWIWTGYRTRRRDGVPSYGLFCLGKRRFLAHRFAWMLVNGLIPKNLVVRHRCDNVICVRPDHLLAGTQAQNLADMRERGRAYFNVFPSGAAHPNAKINPGKAARIRERRAEGKSLVAIGIEFGLHPTTIHDIVRGETWRTA